MRAQPVRILLAIEALREKHTLHCKRQEWEMAERINDKIIRLWRRYHSAVESSGLTDQPQIGSVPFTEYFRIVHHFLSKRGKHIKESDARALYSQGKTALDVIENTSKYL